MLDAEAGGFNPLQLPECELGSEPEPEAAADICANDKQAAEAEIDDGSFRTLSELEFGEALLGKGGVASLSSQLKPKAAALWQARRSGDSSGNHQAETRAVRNFMCTVMEFHAELGTAMEPGECGDAEVQKDPFVQQFKLSSIWEQHGNKQDI